MCDADLGMALTKTQKCTGKNNKKYTLKQDNNAQHPDTTKVVKHMERSTYGITVNLRYSGCN
jgi:hypothetical protein